MEHPNIVKVYDYDKKHIIMEYINSSLIDLLKNDISYDERCNIMHQIMKVIFELKLKGFNWEKYNFDPQNILYDNNLKKVKFIDFERYHNNNLEKEIEEIYKLLNIKPKDKNKIVYPIKIQIKFIERVINFLLNEYEYRNIIDSIYLFGSLTRLNFSKYINPKRYENFIQTQSDVDLSIILKKDSSIPKKWIKLKHPKILYYFLCDLNEVINNENNKENNEIKNPLNSFVFKFEEKDKIHNFYYGFSIKIK